MSESLPAARSVSLGVWVDVGSRHETPEQSGYSHFIEHLVFKGTRRRSARQVASSLESLGGSLNGFTSREQTCFTARVLDEHLPQAIDILADLACNASMTAANMNKERLVICEEIKESIDTPADHIHDLFAEAYWGDHPLGKPIMGTQQNIMSTRRSQLLAFMSRHYLSGSVVIAASGAVSHRKLVHLVRKNFDFPGGAVQSPATAVIPEGSRYRVVSRDNNQTHFCMGFPGVSYADPKRLPIMVLSTYLGSGMSSVLFQKIREEKGLVYTVYSYLETLRDTGVFGTYLGTDKEHLGQAFEIVLKEFRRVRTRKLSSARLNQVKQLIKGQFTIGLESTSARMNWLARQELLSGRYQPLREVLREIDSITPASIQEAANKVFDERNMAIAVLGPVRDGDFNFQID